MGYTEVLCQLCGVSFAIARIRRADEPEEAGWDYSGTMFIDDQDGFDLDGPTCKFLERGGEEREHIAGPACVSACGYSGYRISVEEMNGCRAVQALVEKDEGWEPEEGDQDFEVEGDYFLTGVGQGSPDEGLEDIQPVRHGVDSVIISNRLDNIDDGLPFHPTCFEIFKKVSNLRMGKVDVEGLWYWRTLESGYEDFFERNPFDKAARHGAQQYWWHEPGCEYLAANPIEVPGLSQLLEPLEWYSSAATTFGWKYMAPNEKYAEYHRLPPPKQDVGPDPFGGLSAEITDMILEHLGSKDVANLRLASRFFRQLPSVVFYRLILEEMPWMWELKELPLGRTNWHDLYLKIKFFWRNLKGLQNRKRIWRSVEEIVRRIQGYRGEGKVGE